VATSVLYSTFSRSLEVVRARSRFPVAGCSAQSVPRSVTGVPPWTSALLIGRLVFLLHRQGSSLIALCSSPESSRLWMHPATRSVSSPTPVLVRIPAARRSHGSLGRARLRSWGPQGNRQDGAVRMRDRLHLVCFLEDPRPEPRAAEGTVRRRAAVSELEQELRRHGPSCRVPSTIWNFRGRAKGDQ